MDDHSLALGDLSWRHLYISKPLQKGWFFYLYLLDLYDVLKGCRFIKTIVRANIVVGEATPCIVMIHF